MIIYLSPHTTLSFLLFLLLTPPTSPSNNPDESTYVSNLLRQLTLSQKIGQMSQVDISQLRCTPPSPICPPTTNNEFIASPSKLEYYFGKLAIGSLLTGTSDLYLSTQTYQTLTSQIRNITDTYKLPPVLLGIDAVHGAATIQNSTITPHQINLAATFDTQSVEYAGSLAAQTALKAGIPWLFSPILGLSIEPRWSRVYETFGEDPYLVSVMGKAIIRGIQKNKRSAACAKHFIGYSAPKDGHDRSPSWIPVRHLYQYFAKPFRAVVEDGDGGGVLTMMESYTETDGVPNVANRNTLTTLLRDDIGFEGMVVTDFEEIRNLVNWHKTARDYTGAVKSVLMSSGVDMSMVPFDVEGWSEDVRKVMGIDPSSFTKNDHQQYNSGKRDRTRSNPLAPYPPFPRFVPEQRIDQSVERILRLKHKLRLFDDPFIYNHHNDPEINTLNTVDRQKALEIARNSITLVKNIQHVLPMPSTDVRIHITGPTSNSIPYQAGGWTKQWQGMPSNKESDGVGYGTTVLDAAKGVKGWDVTYSCGVDITGRICDHNDNDNDGNPDDNTNTDDECNHTPASPQTISAIRNVDYVIICIGEETYAEKPGDIRDISLPAGQIRFVQAVASQTSGKVILVYFGGRPRLLGSAVGHSDAVLIAFLPGPDGGRAVVDLIRGETTVDDDGVHNDDDDATAEEGRSRIVSPTGRLPLTYPQRSDGGGVPYWHAVSDMCTDGGVGSVLPNWNYVPCDVEWPFGHGLGYTTFEYGPVVADRGVMGVYRVRAAVASGGDDQDVSVSVVVRNTGSRSGVDTVLFFLFEDYRRTTPEYKRLVGFVKVWLEPGEERVVETVVTAEDVRYVGPDNDRHFVVEPGMRWRVGVGPYSDCRREGAGGEGGDGNVCSDFVEVRLRGHDDDGESSSEADYIGACDAACSIWIESGCVGNGGGFGFESSTSCWNACLAEATASEAALEGDGEGEVVEFASSDGWGWNYVHCLESVVRRTKRMNNVGEVGGTITNDRQCSLMTTACRNVFSSGGRNSRTGKLGQTYDVVAIVFAFVSGFVGSAVILFSFYWKGGIRSKPFDGEKQEYDGMLHDALS